MGNVWSQLVKSGLLSLVALVVLEILIWFGGEYFEIAPKTRALVALIVLLLWGVLFVLQRLLAARTAKLLEQRLGADAQAQLQTVAPGMRGEVEQLERNLKEAIQTLKRSQLGGAALYALPWYIIIGPPGAGKSTALLESGLTFPSVGGSRRSIRGVGGTRNCDWWFTDQGILLDTAGRYTTESEDRDEWLSFLDMLRKSRKHKPINGVIVAIAISDLAGQSDIDIEHHAENIRARLDELAERLQLVFPVYLLFTKCDLLSGFTSFFEDLGRSERAVVWGATFPFGSQAAGKSMQARFDEEFTTLYRGLIARRTGLLAVERPQAKKAGIFQFPVQLALAQNRLSHFVGSLFRPNPYQESCLLRGFYFTSGTQEGAPIDQIMNAMSRAFGLAGGPAEAFAPVEKKSYFLNHLFTKVIFPDQGLARSSASAEKSARLLRMAGLIGFPAAALVMLVMLLVAFFRDHGLIGRVGDVVGKLVAPARVGSLKESLEPLETLRKEIEQVEQRPAGGSMGLRWGKRTSADLGRSLNRAWFDRATLRLLVPVVDKLRTTADELINRTEALTAKDCERLADLVIADEMVGDRKKIEPELLGRVLLDSTLWPEEAKGMEASVGEQLRFFLKLWQSGSGGTRVIRAWTEVDTRRCDAARQKLELRWPLAVYEAEMARQRKELQDIDRDKLAGSHLVVSEAFSRAFTPAEWSRTVRALLQTSARALWGQTTHAGVNLTEAQILERLTEQYKAEYKDHWLKLLRTTRLREDGKLREVVLRNQDLVDKDSQLLAFFAEVRSQQQLDLVGDGKQPPFNASPEDAQKLRSDLDSLAPMQKELRLLVRPEATLLNALASGQLKTAAGKIAETLDALDGIKSDKPYSEAMRRIMDASVRQCVEQLRVTAKIEADALWAKGAAAPFAAISGKFPFVDDLSQGDVRLADLAAFLNAKAGTLWAVEDQLNGLRGIQVNGAPLVQLSAACTSFLGRMRAIRGALFAAKDQERASYAYQVNLFTDSNLISDFRVQTCRSEKPISKLGQIDQMRPIPLSWSQDCCLGMSLAIQVKQVSEEWWPAAADKPDSEWGLFRLVRAAEVRDDPDKHLTRCTLLFPVRSTLKQDLRAGLTLHLDDYQKSPFHPAFFSGISCPAGACE